MIPTPPEIHAHSFNGSWNLDKKRGDDIGPLLKMQGLPWIVRQVAIYSPAYVNLKMYKDDDGVVHLDQEQCTPARSNVEPRTITGAWKNVTVEFWGEINGYSK